MSYTYKSVIQDHLKMKYVFHLFSSALSTYTNLEDMAYALKILLIIYRSDDCRGSTTMTTMVGKIQMIRMRMISMNHFSLSLILLFMNFLTIFTSDPI